MRSIRHIVHVDMDAFFAAIEQRDEPEYRSKPVVVGADPKGGRGRGVVSTCSYEARLSGIRSAMPISEAYRKCPHAIFLPVDMQKYQNVSSRIYEILRTFTPEIEPAGIDEAFLDISGSCHLFAARGRRANAPMETCRLIKSRIKESTGLTASVGLAPTKMAAKIASDLKKPDGLVEVTEEGLLDFLRPLEVRRIYGLGAKAEAILHAMGIGTIGELADSDRGKLIGALGKNGGHFWELAKGIDGRAVSSEREVRSISGEQTFSEDTSETDRIRSGLMRLCEKVSARLRQGSLKCRTVTVKIRLKGFATYTRSATIRYGTNFADILYKETKGLYNKFDRNGSPVRLIGVKASNIFPAGTACGLFDCKDYEKQEMLHRAIDRIQNKFGDGCICHATGLDRGEKSKRSI